jgi:hypothetical protein
MAEIIDEIVALMQGQPDESGGWMRAADIQTKLNLSHKTTMKYLHTLHDQGRLEVAYIAARAITGCETKVPAYRLKIDNQTS